MKVIQSQRLQRNVVRRRSSNFSRLASSNTPGPRAARSIRRQKQTQYLDNLPKQRLQKEIIIRLTPVFVSFLCLLAVPMLILTHGLTPASVGLGLILIGLGAFVFRKSHFHLILTSLRKVTATEDFRLAWDNYHATLHRFKKHENEMPKLYDFCANLLKTTPHNWAEDQTVPKTPGQIQFRIRRLKRFRDMMISLDFLSENLGRLRTLAAQYTQKQAPMIPNLLRKRADQIKALMETEAPDINQRHFWIKYTSKVFTLRYLTQQDLKKFSPKT